MITMKLWYLVLAGIIALLPLAPQAMADDKPSKRQAKAKKSKERNVHRAAINKKKELRKQGVRKVRVNAPGDWPRLVSVPKDTELGEGQPGNPGHSFTSNHFLYVSPVKLDEAAQKTVARLCECAHAANKAIGEVLPVPRATADRGEKKFLVQLMPTMEAYHAAGGPKNSAGVFLGAVRRMGAAGSGVPRTFTEKDIAIDKVLIPFPSLGLGTDGTVVKPDIDTHALVHELTHQQFFLNFLPIWVNEGWAEYVGYIPYVGEDLDFTQGFSLILHKAKEFAEHGALDFDFKLADFFTMDQQTMYGYMSTGKNTYMLSVMTVAFFVHLDGKKGVEAMKAYLQALIDGKTPEDAAQELIKPHRTAERLQQDFIRAWKAKRVKVSFPKK